MMKRFLNTFWCLLVGLLAFAQEPELTVEQHLEDYDFVVKYIEDNYAGFPDKVVDSTRADYEALKTRLRSQVSNGERPGWQAVAEYTAWFNDAHLYVHLVYCDEQGNYINWTEHYSKKKEIHYESQMEYDPKPVACKVTNKTFLIRFPSCEGDPDMKWVKNSIKQFKKSHCENLIIDIRGNEGGSDGYWDPYFSLLYDHDATYPAPEYRNTQQNITYMCEKKWKYAGTLKKMSKKSPELDFIGNGYKVIRKGKVDKTVQKAAIIIDNKVASAAESMTRMIRDCSSRTHIFGKDNTRGCNDYSNVALLEFRHIDHYFQVPMSRLTGLPETGTDATGIAPDVRIDLPLPARLTDNIDEWTIWVAEQLEK